MINNHPTYWTNGGQLDGWIEIDIVWVIDHVATFSFFSGDRWMGSSLIFHGVIVLWVWYLVRSVGKAEEVVGDLSFRLTNSRGV